MEWNKILCLLTICQCHKCRKDLKILKVVTSIKCFFTAYFLILSWNETLSYYLPLSIRLQSCTFFYITSLPCNSEYIKTDTKLGRCDRQDSLCWHKSCHGLLHLRLKAEVEPLRYFPSSVSSYGHNEKHMISRTKFMSWPHKSIS